MRILVLSPIFPDAPSDGDRLRLYYFLRELSRRHELHLACFVDPTRPEDGNREALKGIVSQIHSVPLSRGSQWLNAGLRLLFETPANVNAFASPAMHRLVASLLESNTYDAVYCHRLRMAPYALRAKVPRVIDFTDSLTRYFERRAAQSTGFKRRYWRREAQKVAAYESFCAWHFDAGLMNSEGDAATLRAMAPHSNVITASNGVDFSKLKPRGGKRDPNSLVFVGNLAYPPNSEAVTWFATEIFPRILKSWPAAKFRVIGGNAPSSLRPLRALPGVEFMGFASDFRPLLSSAAVSVCPVRLAAGRQNKILDAFSCGTPVVATGLTAFGCEAAPEKHLLAADDAEAFADQVLRLMKRPALGQKLAKAALSFVRGHYDWAKSARLIESALKAKR